MPQQPIGFVALCQCGKVFGVVGGAETDHVEAAQIIVKVTHRGCLLIPEFGGTWVFVLSLAYAALMLMKCLTTWRI